MESGQVWHCGKAQISFGGASITNEFVSGMTKQRRKGGREEGKEDAAFGSEPGGEMGEGRGQKAEGRGQRAQGRRQKGVPHGVAAACDQWRLETCAWRDIRVIDSTEKLNAIPCTE